MDDASVHPFLQTTGFDVAAVRAQFPILKRQVNGQAVGLSR